MKATYTNNFDINKPIKLSDINNALELLKEYNKDKPTTDFWIATSFCMDSMKRQNADDIWTDFIFKTTSRYWYDLWFRYFDKKIKYMYNRKKRIQKKWDKIYNTDTKTVKIRYYPQVIIGNAVA